MSSSALAIETNSVLANNPNLLQIRSHRSFPGPV